MIGRWAALVMTEDGMRLRAHHNVIDMAEERRKRERPARVELVDLAERLTLAEIEAMMQRAKERSAYYKRAFARLMAAPESDWWRDE